MNLGGIGPDWREPVSPASASLRGRWLREALWLTARRGRSYLLLMALASGLSLAALAVTGIWQSSTEQAGRPVAIDFAAFWGAGRLALKHVPASAYNVAEIYAEETSGSRLPPGQLYPFLYPPAFLLLCVPLALLPYLVSLWTMVITTAALLINCLRRIAPEQSSWLAIAAFPGFLLNVGNGQASCLFAACFGGACLFLERRPALAGMCLGCLVCKPHLAVCVPVGLIAARRWTAVATFAVTASFLLAFSWFIFGTATWSAFLAHAGGAAAALTDSQALGRMQSVFSAVLLLHGTLPIAMAAQVAAALASSALLVSVACKRPGAGTEISAILLATLAATPYLFDYDLVCLAIPIAWWASELRRTGPFDWERSVLAAAFVLPLVARSAGIQLGIPVTPAVVFSLIILLGMRVRRAARSAGGLSDGQAAPGDFKLLAA